MQQLWLTVNKTFWKWRCTSWWSFSVTDGRTEKMVMESSSNTCLIPLVHRPELSCWAIERLTSDCTVTPYWSDSPGFLDKLAGGHHPSESHHPSPAYGTFLRWDYSGFYHEASTPSVPLPVPHPKETPTSAEFLLMLCLICSSPISNGWGKTEPSPSNNYLKLSRNINILI